MLRAGQLGRRRLLVLAVIRAHRNGPESAAQILPALGLFETVERAAPKVAEWVLAHPMVDVWATRCLMGIRKPDLGYLSALAAAAAAHAGIQFEITIPCPDGRFVLPTFGAVHDLGHGVAVVSGSGSRVQVSGSRGCSITVDDDPRWMPIRRVTAGPPNSQLIVDIEDLDSYRADYPWPPARRLSQQQADRISSLIRDAWDWIVLHCPQYVPAISGLLRAFVPVVGPQSGYQVSAVTRTAFGAVALSEPQDADALALLMIHELQHAKLGAAMDLIDLYVSDGLARHRAPWRLDPRPVEALLQGAYAHLGVTDVWRIRRMHWRGVHSIADFQFGYWRMQTSRAISTLSQSGELTQPGIDFVGAMATTLDAWETEPLPGSVTAAVHDVDHAGLIGWRLRNVTPDPKDVAELAAAWRSGDRAAVPPPGAPHPSLPCPADLDGLAAGIARRTCSAASVTTAQAELDCRHDVDGTGRGNSARESAGDITVADHAFLTADYADAATAYRRRLLEAPDDDQAWIGFSLSLSRIAKDPSAVISAAGTHMRAPDFVQGSSHNIETGKLVAAVRGLLMRPELVRALYTSLSGQDTSPPEDIAAWLAGYSPQSTGGSM
jgi:uncharacterized protein